MLPEEGVVVETRGAFVQGIFGVGGETHGAIAIAVGAPDAELSADRIDGSRTRAASWSAARTSRTRR